MSQRLPAVVAGAGIAGLSAALALALAGRDVHVFERAETLTDEGAGIQLSPNATRHLRGLGVLDRLQTMALAPEAAIVRRGRDATVLAKLDLHDAERRYGAPFRVVHRADLHQVLAEAVAEQPRIALTFGKAVTSWIDDGELRVGAGDCDMPADTLIIADGVRSALRDAFEPGAPFRHSGRTAWRTLLPAEACPAFARAPVTNLWLGPSAHLVHYPLRGGSVVNLVAVMAGTGDDEHSVESAFADWSRDASDFLARADTWRAWPLFSRALPSTLARGRVALAGDAAHPMMPFLAQGGAQAIEDAAALGDAFTREADAANALARYARARKSRVAAVVAASERQAKIYHLGGVAAAVRNAAMRLAGETGLRLATDWIYRA